MSMQAVAKHIELWLIDKLIPWARNPRTHSDAQVAQIAASIAELGFNNPILVDTKAGIIAGHGRLLAARKLGLKEVAVIVLDHLSEAQKRAYIIADNQLALNAGWNDELLGIELRLHHLSSAAVSTLGKVMLDSATPPSTKVRAADSILDHTAKAIEIEG
jgi:ParB-like chromosome segregation protein Spo0J